MTLVLESRHVTAVRRHGEADYPREACGLIGGTLEGGSGRKVAVTLLPVMNARRDAPRNRYLIEPASFRRAQERLARDGLDVIGVYHSHPDAPARPSAFYRENAWPRLSYVIAAVVQRRAGEVRSWVLSDDRKAFDEEPLTLVTRTVVWQSQS